MTRPRDMLEFFRRTAPERGAEAPPSAPTLEPTTRMLVVRRSQAVVVAAAAGAALLLAFLLGHAVGGSGGGDESAAAAEVYVIRAVAYDDDARGMSFARRTKEQLDKLNLGDEVQVFHVPSENRTVVAVGSWLSDPLGRKDACDLRDKLRAMKDSTQATPFANADFWRMER